MGKLPLYKQIQADIKKQIAFGSLRSGDRIPSEADLARKYFVSQITSKNALNALVDEGLLFRIQGKGTFVSGSLPGTNQSFPSLNDQQVFNPTYRGTIGLLVPAMVTKVDQKLLNQLERFISQENYHLLFHITRESITEEAFTINAFRNLGVKGLIIFPVVDEKYNEMILRLTLEKFPYVLVDRYFKNINVNSITSDNTNGAYNAVNFLLDNGHKNIAFVAPKITNSAVEDRVAGFEKAMAEKNIPINKNDWCIFDLDINESNYSFDFIHNFLTEHPHITAALTANAEMAQYLYYSLKRLNKNIPKDFEIVSFDQPYLPGVSFIAQNEEEISRKAVDLLISQINYNFDVQQCYIPTKLVKVSDKTMQDKPPTHLLYILNS